MLRGLRVCLLVGGTLRGAIHSTGQTGVALGGHVFFSYGGGMVNPDQDGLINGVLVHGGTEGCPDYTVFVCRTMSGDAVAIDRKLRDLMGTLADARDAIRAEARRLSDGLPRLDSGS